LHAEDSAGLVKKRKTT